MLLVVVTAAVAFRCATLALATRNERALKDDGGAEFGSLNSQVLAGAHVLRIRQEEGAMEARFGRAA